jgi:hypothetical protein
MLRATKTLLLGMALGAVGMMVAWHFRRLAQENDPEALIDRLGRDLDDLERSIPPKKA